MKKVLLIYGGLSSEHDVSIKSAKSIEKHIDKNKFDLTKLYITKNNEWLVNNKKIDNIIDFLNRFDVVFPITHGKYGEDGKLQGLLDFFNLKYVGSKCGSSYIAMDKIRTKQILSYYHIPQVPYQIYKKKDKLIIPYPVIIKPANGGSSIGISVANNKKEFKKGLKEALKYDENIIVEKFIKGQELECAVLEDKNIITSTIGEIKSANTFYDYEAKYENKESKLIIPANIDNNISNKIKEYSKQIFKMLDLKDLSRIDFFYDKENDKIYLNEINTLPGFTDISMYPMLLDDIGINYQDLITKLLYNAIKRPN